MIPILISVVGMALYTTLLEYLVHRFVDHRRIVLLGWQPEILAHLYRTHCVEHHGDYGPGESYLYDGHSRPLDRLDLPLLVWSHAPAIPVYVGLWFWAGPASVIACAIYVTVYYTWFLSGLHYTVHHPGPSRADRRGLVRALNFHHWLHHRHTRKNYSFTFPVWDYVFFTKATPTEDERVDFERIAAGTPREVGH